MRTILRKKAAKLFFEGPDRWTGDPHKAFNFKSIDHALRFIRQWKLTDVEVAFSFRDRDEVTAVPLDRIALRFTET